MVTLDEISGAVLTLVRLGAAFRLVYCMVRLEGAQEEQGQYRGKSRRFHIDMQDISGLQKAKLYRNGSCAAVWEREELLEKQGLLTYTVPEENRWQTLQVRAWDGAGNESVTKKLHVYVTDSRMLQFWEDMRLYGAIGLFLLCGGAAGTGFVRRRKKTKA